MSIALVTDWKAILTKAWSVKFNVAAALFGGAELAVQLVKPDGIEPGLFAALAALVSICATGARVLAQKELTSGPVK